MSHLWPWHCPGLATRMEFSAGLLNEEVLAIGSGQAPSPLWASGSSAVRQDSRGLRSSALNSGFVTCHVPVTSCVAAIK
jgi:hypothetical protein